MFEVFQQIFEKLISVGAAFFIFLGVVQMPIIPEFTIPPRIITVATTTTEVEPPHTEVRPQEVSKLPAPPVVLPQATPPPLVSAPYISLNDLNEKVRRATVNILCESRNPRQLQSISGSGVIVHDRGVILTNAHVAQYFLLSNHATCKVRAGSPAIPAYTVQLVYVNPSWVLENASMITQSIAHGSGERDFALLEIINSTNDSHIPFSFVTPRFNLDGSILDKEVLLVGYPAEFLAQGVARSDLPLVSTTAVINQLYSFADDLSSLDVLGLGGSIIAQSGASGGPVVSTEGGDLLGIIVTTTEAKTTGERDLRAITLPHIARTFFDDTGYLLEKFLAGEVEAGAVQSSADHKILQDILLEHLR